MALARVSKNLVCHGVSASRLEPGKLALIVTATILLTTALSPTLSAQTNVNPSTTQSANRYLFIVETSRAMQSRARGVFDAIKHALDSSLNGQIHQGDLVGIWTFNEVLYQELFPTQVWAQPTQLAFAVRLPTFADPELYQKRARLDKVIPEMLKVVADSENITVILVTTGDGVMQGTPFDAQINSAWNEWHDELEGIHMPLQTVIRGINAQPTAWIMTPAPRPIDLAKLEVVLKSSGQKGNNPAGVILESGLVTNQATSIGTEQKVAFSVWALGQTSQTASATSPQRISTPQSKSEYSAPAPVDAPANMPNGHASNTVAPQAEPSKTESAAVPAKDQPNKPVVSESKEGQEAPIASNGTVVQSSSNTPPTDNGKPVELVFVTNAPSAARVSESPVKETTSPASVPLAPAASSMADVPADHQLSLLAHARAADPEEKAAADVALATPPRGFLRDNIQPLLLMIVAGFGAIYCFKMWLRANARQRGVSVSLAHENEEDSSQSEEPQRISVRRR